MIDFLSNQKYLKTIFFLTILTGLAGTPCLVAFAENETPATFSLRPAKVELEVSPGEAASTEIFATNNLGRTAIFEVTVGDITASADPTVGIEVLENGQSEYSLKNFITFSPQTFSLPDGGTQTISVSVRLPADISRGGRYGVLFISPVPESVGASGTSLRSRLGATFFVRPTGRVSESGKLLAFDTVNGSRWFIAGPPRFQIHFQNEGNVHLRPYGVIRISNMFGRVVEEVPVEPWFILPNSERTRVIDWNERYLMRRYKAKLLFNRGYGTEIEVAEVGFFALSGFGILTLAVVIALVFFIIWRLRRMRAT